MENTNLNIIPADEIASTTPTVETTGEPVTEQAPSQIDNTSTVAAKLPDGYLVGGFMESTPDGKQRYLRRDYVNRYAKELAAILSTGTPPLTAAAFRTAFLRDKKKLLARDTPDGAKLAAVATMEVRAVKLVASEKAPALLVDMMEAVTAAVTDADTFRALCTHLDAVYTYILLREPKKAKEQKGGDA